VGWDVRETMPEDLMSEAFRRALVICWAAAGLVVHSDQGSQYTATRFRDLLAQPGMAPCKAGAGAATATTTLKLV
jgi:putative transposase